ncbi:ABC transporter permease [Streptomyces sp. NPDC059816]|uniref:ABC transporter permease n=1 Tax=Streptomyces sp. NPDC059816 TaxID=3346960 RepID=UPI00365B21BE
MLRLMRHHLMHHWARSVALLAGILVAVSSFVVLTATTESSKLTVTGTIAKSRVPYDLLVRPKGSAQELEKAEGLIRPNSLSDVYGGITTDQLATVREVPGVDVAAPLAMLGHTSEPGGVAIDLAELIPKGTRGTFDLGRTWEYDRGLSTIKQRTHTVFITPHPLEAKPGPKVEQTEASGAVTYHTSRFFEVLPSGERREVCKGTMRKAEHVPGLSSSVTCLSWAKVTETGPDFEQSKPGPRTRVLFNFPVSYLVAGVDPVAEAELFGLDEAVTKGKYLSPAGPLHVTKPDQSVETTLPMLRSERAANALAVRVSLTRRGEDRPLLRKRFEAGARQLDHPIGKRSDMVLPGFLATQPITYDLSDDGTLRPRSVKRPPLSQTILPLDGQDVWFRTLVPQQSQAVQLRSHPKIVGTFDAERLPEFDAASRVPLGTYGAPALTGADDRSRKLLGGDALRPGASPASYVQQPPLMLVSLASTQWLADNGYMTRKQSLAPVSAIRVRVAGVSGADEVSRERVRIAAQEIQARTGLHVDVVLGSSPVARTVVLPAGENGRPELRLTEWWSKKNVATQIIKASDAKSLVLLVLVLVVCTLFVANAAASAVRSRRGELGLLAAVGWQRRHLFTIVLGELLLLGTIAGISGTGVAWAAGIVLDIDVPPTRAALAIPVALAVALVSGAIPAWLAARVHPITALRPAVTTGRRTRMFAGIVGMALAGATRARGRTLLGAAAVATAAAATVLLLAATYTFQGTLAGSLLGETISVQVRSTDIAAVITMVVLSTVAVGDVIYLGVQDRAAEFALLRAVGWDERVTTRLVLTEGTLIGLLGTLTGTLLGTTATLWLAPTGNTGDLLIPTVSVVVAGTALSAAAALVPVLIQRRTPTARLLAEE